MNMHARVISLPTLPQIEWHWEVETDILSGAFPATPGAGPTGTMELADNEGAVAVLDLLGGTIAGLDIVVWPELITVLGLVSPPPGERGAVSLQPGPMSADSKVPTTIEMDAALSICVDPSASVLHLRIGGKRSVTVVQVADHLAVEVDALQRLAGFWLSGVPPAPAGE